MRLLRAILLAGCLVLPVRAQESGSPEALAAARELSAIMTGDTMTQIAAALTAQIWPSIERAFGSKVDAATMAEMRGEFEQTVTAFTADVMKDAPQVYARHFSAQEIKDMVAFYKSPTGVKALHEMPKVMADVGTQMAPRMQAFEGDLNARVRAVLQKHGYKD
jgi:uncharacterized protein